MTLLVGALGHRHRASVDERGGITPRATGWELRWWVGADDRWHVPEREVSVRQTLIDAAPVVQTAMRVPGGDALHRVYGAAGDGDPIVVEVENASPAPFVVAFVASGLSNVALDGAHVLLDGRPALVSARAPSRWSCDVGSVEVEVMSGGAHAGGFPQRRDRGARLVAAFLHPVPHRATVRLALPGRGDASGVAPASLPDAEAVARGWRAQLDRGMTVQLPAPSLVEAIRVALGVTLLDVTGGRPDPRSVAALEDWGFDEEARVGWSALTGRQRRAAARRSSQPASWLDVVAAGGESGEALLLAVRSMLAHDGGDGISLLGDLPEEWRGAPIDVRGAPTRHGLVSYSVRWHDRRAALLWDAPTGVTLRAPGLEPTWSTTNATGEALLG